MSLVVIPFRSEHLVLVIQKVRFNTIDETGDWGYFNQPTRQDDRDERSISANSSVLGYGDQGGL